jgi:serine O-acetyltransferase
MRIFRSLVYLLVFFPRVNVNSFLFSRVKTRRQYAPFRLAVRADVTRLYGRYSLGLLLRACLLVRTFRPVFTMRLCQAASGLPTPLSGLLMFPFRLLHIWAQQLAGIDFPWKTEIKPGFVITHGWGLVISPAAMIGSNVTVFHGVTIGQKHKITASGRVKSYPSIEDEVWIGPHAVIAGGVVVGRGSRIAPGTIVTDDVEPYSIVGGNPMRVIRTDALPDVLNPATLSV